MADGTKIEWTDATWNPITGCSVVSPGCTNCYAMKLAGTRLKYHPTRTISMTEVVDAGRLADGAE
jgi:protein gp37